MECIGAAHAALRASVIAAALPRSCTRRPGDGRLTRSPGFTPANASVPTMAGMQVCVPLPTRNVHFALLSAPLPRGSCDKASVFPKNVNGGAVEAEAGAEFRSASLNRRGFKVAGMCRTASHLQWSPGNFRGGEYLIVPQKSFELAEGHQAEKHIVIVI